MQRRPSRMALRHVERVEVVVRGLYLSAVDHVAEAEEDVFDLAPDLRDQMQVSALVPLSGQRDVDALLGEAPVGSGALEELSGAPGPPARSPRASRSAPARSRGRGPPERLLEARSCDPGSERGHRPSRRVQSACNRAQSLGFKRLRLHAPTVPTATPCAPSSHVLHPWGRPLPPSSSRLSAKFAQRCAETEPSSRGDEPVRHDRGALRPVERERRRGRGVLPRRGAGRAPAGRRAQVGTGRVAIPIAAEGIRVIGVDSSAGMLGVCRQRAELAGVAATSTCVSATSVGLRSKACRARDLPVSLPSAPRRRGRSPCRARGGAAW